MVSELCKWPVNVHLPLVIQFVTGTAKTGHVDIRIKM